MINVPNEEPWWYLSFANYEEGFNGAVIVQAHSSIGARVRMLELGIEIPGHNNQVVMVEIPTNLLPEFPPDSRNRLLTEKELRERFEGKSLWEMEGAEGE